jgi:hypothetical protein
VTDPAFDALASRYFLGMLSEREREELVRRLEAGEGARKRFAEEAVLAASLHEWAAGEAAARRRFPFPKALWGAAAVALAAVAAWWVAERPRGPFVEAAGEGAVVVRGGRELPAWAGLDLAEGDVLRAGPGAVSVGSREGSGRVELGPGAEGAFAGRRLDLRRGRLTAFVAPGSAWAAWAFATPDAEVRVSGTRFRIWLEGARRTRVEVDSGATRVRRRSDGAEVAVPAGRFLVVPLSGPMAPALSLGSGHPLGALRPGHWHEVPQSPLRDVQARPPEIAREHFLAIGGPQAFQGICAWSGGAYDTLRDRLVLWGGGSQNYGGNELYAFSVPAMAWERINAPASPEGRDPGRPVFADGTPLSRPTYDSVAYLPPPVDRFFVGGGAVLWKSEANDATTWLFDFERARWERGPEAPSGGLGALCAYDPRTGSVWQRGTGPHTKVSQFDPAAKAWTVRTPLEDMRSSGRMTMELDPAAGWLVAVGGGAVWVWAARSAEVGPRESKVTDGPQEVVRATAPGFAYDPGRGRFVGWAGGRDVYTLDPRTWVWTRHSPPGESSADPGPPHPSGTFGRFAYVPSRDAFILVNGVDRNVFFYRLP